MKRKHLSLVLSLLMLVSLLVAPVLAAAEADTPTFKVTLEDDTPLSVQDLRVLVPEGVDRIRIHLGSGARLTDYSGTPMEADAGNKSRYTLTLENTRLTGENLDLFLKGLNLRSIAAKKNPEKFGNFAQYETGTYGGVLVDQGDGKPQYLDLYWQVDLPKLETLSLTGAVFYTPLVATDLKQQFVLNKNSDQAVISFTLSQRAAKTYLQDGEGKTITNGLVVKNGVYSFTVKEGDFGDEATVNRYLILEDERGNKQIITFTGARRLLDSPDAVVDYLCLGSQYSDGGNQLTGIYGLYPEKSLIGRGYWWSPISLGNFGGYITYYYEKGVQDGPNNPYGIDFIVYGNSNGGTGFSEPGNVLVSEDGKTWYTLAGSHHYEDGTKWDYTVVYQKDEKGNTVANGTSLPYWYPQEGNYPLHDWSEGEEESITVSGVLLSDSGDGNAAYPPFGYADVHTNSRTAWGTGEIVTVDGKAKNPYLSVTKQTGLQTPSDAEEIYEGAGDCFDLAWAVDEKGLPAALEEIHYIKVQTASLTLISGGIGEKSTEVNVVVPVTPGASAVGVSKPPVKISVGGTSLPLKEGVYQYAAAVKGPFTMQVEADAAANVYINNLRASSRDFAVAPDKGVIRIIVQEGEKEPLIYYITVNSDPLIE